MATRLFVCFGKGICAESSESKHNATADVTTEEQRRNGSILVELFSSQGCETSPEAELLVSRLGRGDFALNKSVIVLVFHVDYWDYMGWKDPYGSSLWTVRQKAYVEALKLDNIFTPQVVVQGRSHCMGNDEEALLSAIMSSQAYPALALQATFLRPTPDSLQVTLTGPLRMKFDGNPVNVMVALYESGIVSECPEGTNKGKVLSNDYVVRKLEKLCTIKDISAKKAITGTLNFVLREGFNCCKCGLAVFVQDSSYQIFGCQNIPLPVNL